MSIKSLVDCLSYKFPSSEFPPILPDDHLSKFEFIHFAISSDGDKDLIESVCDSVADFSKPDIVVTRFFDDTIARFSLGYKK